MSPDSMSEHFPVTLLSSTHARQVWLLGCKKPDPQPQPNLHLPLAKVRNTILKLYSPLVDVSAIARNMDLARSRVRVPEVYCFGRSGNCAFIQMEFIEGFPLDYWMSRNGVSTIPPSITDEIKRFIDKLANVGLSHNDLYPRNVLVDRCGKMLAVIDWDTCRDVAAGGEYARRLAFPEGLGTEWNVFILKHSDWMGEIDLFQTYSSSIRRHPPLVSHA